MAKRGKKIGGQHYELKYSEEFKQLIKGKKPAGPQTFLGFTLRSENVNQLWNWKTLKDESI